MKNQHCEQSETLNFVPSPISKITVRKGGRKEKVLFEIKNKFTNKIYSYLKDFLPSLFKISPLFYVICLVFLLWNILPKDYFVSGEYNGIVICFCFVLLFFSIIIGKRWSEKKEMSLKNARSINYSFRVLETGMTIRNQFYFYFEIEKVNSYKTKDEHNLSIRLRNNQNITLNLPFRNYKHTKPFYLALAWTAQFVEVHFQAEDSREKELLRSVVKNYAGNLFLVEHLSSLGSSN
ncbi:hypothetical protein V9L05_19135 [Bernardetia sp. Wsw4-3y2]